MNRRDTVIVASIVNAVLLVVLFMTAKHSDNKVISESLPTIPSKLTVSLATPAASSNTNTASPSSNDNVKNDNVKPIIVKEEIVKQFLEEKPVVKSIENHEKNSEDTVVIDTNHQSLCQEKISNTLSGNEKKTQPSYATVVVKKGDFLERIARANHTTVASIMQINDLTTTQLKIGQVLKVPVLKDNAVITVADKVAVTTPEDYYTVKEGDSLWSVALRNQMKLDDLLKLNDLDENKARRIRPGDQLRIR